VITVAELATIPLFSTLAENELEYLVGSVEDIHLTPGNT
jgi:thioredoxin reductase (NADPH)